MGQSDDPRYINSARLEASAEGTLEEVRGWLFFTLGLSELFDGCGYTKEPDGRRGYAEYLMKNRRVSSFAPGEFAWVQLPLIMEELGDHVVLAQDAAFLIRFHAWFAAAAAILLGPCFPKVTQLPEAPYSSGSAVCSLVVAWHAAIAAGTSSRPRLHQMWRFVAVLSVFMVLPDWFLADVLGTLVFPEDGAWRIGGTVSVYMAGLWSIPLLWLLACFPAPRAGSCEPSLLELLGAAVAALLVFGASEQLTVPLRLWLATNKVRHTAGHVALYVLPAEAALGAATLHAYRTTAVVTGWTGTARRVLAAAAVALLYAGALAVSYLAVEGA